MNNEKGVKAESDSSRWEAAIELLKPIGSVAANFSVAVRTLLSYHERDTPTLSAGAQNHIIRLLRNNTVKATYYYVTKAYRPHLLQQPTPIKSKDFLAMYTPFEHAVLLAYCYLFRSLAKKSSKEEWEYIQSPLYEALEIGACIGSRVPAIGLAAGLLGRGMRYLAFAPFLISDARAFVQYRRHLRTKDLPFDLTREIELWGCTNIQVAALLMESVGFNKTLAMQFVAAAEGDTSMRPDTRYGVPFRFAEALLESYMERGEMPDTLPTSTGVVITLTKDERMTLLGDLGKAVGSTERIEWLSKGSGSINPASSPELFTQSLENSSS
jgi:hypothetical protein